MEAGRDWDAGNAPAARHGMLGCEPMDLGLAYNLAFRPRTRLLINRSMVDTWGSGSRYSNRDAAAHLTTERTHDSLTAAVLLGCCGQNAWSFQHKSNQGTLTSLQGSPARHMRPAEVVQYELPGAHPYRRQDESETYIEAIQAP
jgi:hypothetical protein